MFIASEKTLDVNQSVNEHLWLSDQVSKGADSNY